MEGTFSYEYDAAGRNTRLVYPDTHERLQTWDALGRLVERCYVYGAVSRCYGATYDGEGNPVTLTDPESTRQIIYDALGRVVSVTWATPGEPEHVETYSYNPLGGHAVYGAQVREDERPRLGGGGTAQDTSGS